MDWQDNAACRGRATTLAVTDYDDLPQVWAARDLCRACPVLAPCRAWALAMPTREDLSDEVIAGLTPKERRGKRKAREVVATLPSIEEMRERAAKASAANQAKRAQRAALQRVRFAELLEQGHTVGDAARQLGISRRTGDRYLADLRRLGAGREAS